MLFLFKISDILVNIVQIKHSLRVEQLIYITQAIQLVSLICIVEYEYVDIFIYLYDLNKNTDKSKLKSICGKW